MRPVAVSRRHALSYWADLRLVGFRHSVSGREMETHAEDAGVSGGRWVGFRRREARGRKGVDDLDGEEAGACCGVGHC
eukprot:3906728-Rhodomonas_salina.2